MNGVFACGTGYVKACCNGGHSVCYVHSGGAKRGRNFSMSGSMFFNWESSLRIVLDVIAFIRLASR